MSRDNSAKEKRKKGVFVSYQKLYKSLLRGKPYHCNTSLEILFKQKLLVDEDIATRMKINMTYLLTMRIDLSPSHFLPITINLIPIWN